MQVKTGENGIESKSPDSNADNLFSLDLEILVNQIHW